MSNREAPQKEPAKRWLHAAAMARPTAGPRKRSQRGYGMARRFQLNWVWAQRAFARHSGAAIVGMFLKACACRSREVRDATKRRVMWYLCFGLRKIRKEVSSTVSWICPAFRFSLTRLLTKFPQPWARLSERILKHQQWAIPSIIVRGPSDRGRTW